MVDASLESGRQVRLRGGGFEPISRPWVAWAFFALLLVLWEAGSRARLIDPLFLPPPSQIWRALEEMTVSGELARHLGASLGRIAAGWLIGTAAGAVLGGLIGLSWLGRSVGLPFISALFPVPKIALLPLLILWLGIGESSKIATIALGVFFPTVIAVYSGVDQVPNNLIRMAQSFELPFLAIVRKVVVPGALPNIVAGFRISASIALLLVVSAEMIGAETGIGAFVLQAGNLMQTDQLMAGVVVLSILGLAVARGIGALEARVTRWR